MTKVANVRYTCVDSRIVQSNNSSLAASKHGCSNDAYLERVMNWAGARYGRLVTEEEAGEIARNLDDFFTLLRSWASNPAENVEQEL